MNDGYLPAIEELETELSAVERKAAALRVAIDLLRNKSGLPKANTAANRDVPSWGQGASGASLSDADEPYAGKSMQAAVCDYLDVRRRRDFGPAKPREIFEALVRGGFAFKTKTDDIALVSLRTMLRKNTQLFRRDDSGRYSLVEADGPADDAADAA